MASNHRSLKFTIFLKQRNKLQTFKIKKMIRRRTRPETPPHIHQDTRYKTPELEETPEDRRRRKSRKLSAVKNYYKALNSLNTITLNPIGASTHSTTQAQLVQRRPRMNYNLARSSIKTFKPTVVCGKHVVCGRHMLPRISISCEHCQALHWPMESLTNCYHDILTDIQHDLHMHNPFAQVFRSAGQFIREGQPIMLKLLSGQGFDIRRYNRPTADEVAVLLIENDANSENLHNSVSDPENDIDLADEDLDNELRQTQHRKHVTIRDYAAYCLYT
ncbi:7667_t:CDS:2 [Racocetra fulgida]|uniref:7667_t:CDS:1 n=1 Tax=Racocetra fulgida TaxID=60492 RepID=A0A9N9C8Z9_9GLOM|nr:7667_t:CDS:2 [Racocetra fulgida]